MLIIVLIHLLVLLNCFLQRKEVESALRGALVEEEMVEVRPGLVPMKVLDQSVSINQIKKYFTIFTIDAWKQVEGVIAVLQDKGVWSCVRCSGALETSESISCDCCLNWMHMKCVGLKSQPKKKYWICRTCHSEDTGHNNS
jgi:hypothetical protein